MITPVILAAGRSSRMGRPKAFLPFDSEGNTFLGHLLTIFFEADLRPVFVVGRPDDRSLAEESGRLGATFVANPDADQGQISSFRAAIQVAEAKGAEGILVVPVDVPLVTAAVLRRLVEAAQSSSAAIIRACHAGRHGHPVIFKKSLFDELRRGEPTLGARTVVRADPARVLDLEVDSAGVLADIDTPEDYAREFGRR